MAEVHVRHARHAGLALVIIGLLIAGRGIYEVARGRIYQTWQGRQVDRALDSIPTQPVVGVRRVSYQMGSAIGRLEIPRLALSVVVLEGSEADSLRLGVGRLHNSSLPGEPGNVVLAGHRDTFFRSLREIRKGDQISLRTPQGMFAYTVDWTQVVDPAETGVLQTTASPSLTLVTCYPFTYIGSAPKRFIVRASPAASGVPTQPSFRESPFAAPAHRRHPVPSQTNVAVVVTPESVVDEPGAPPVAESESSAADAKTDEPAPDKPKHGIRGVFHKIGGVFSRRAKMQ